MYTNRSHIPMALTPLMSVNPIMSVNPSMPVIQSALMASNPAMTSDNLEFYIKYNKIRLLVRSYNNNNFNDNTPQELLQTITILAFYYIGRSYPSYYNLTFFFNLMVNIIEYLIQNINKMDDILNNLLNDRMGEIEQYLSGFEKMGKHKHRREIRIEKKNKMKLEVFIKNELPKLAGIKEKLMNNLFMIKNNMINNGSIDFYNNVIKNIIIIAENINETDEYYTGLVYLFGEDDEDDGDKTQEERMQVIGAYNNELRSSNYDHINHILYKCIISEDFDYYFFHMIYRNNLRMELLRYK